MTMRLGKIYDWPLAEVKSRIIRSSHDVAERLESGTSKLITDMDEVRNALLGFSFLHHLT